jgi:altronate dehydratase
MLPRTDFSQVGRLPSAGDNVAIAVRRLEAGLRVEGLGEAFTLERAVLEGHRFAVRPIAAGEVLLSWGLSFGRALRQIQPGDYVCNELMLQALRGRAAEVELPAMPNFADYAEPYALDESLFRPGAQVPLYPEDRFFQGYPRAGSRGVGTRNYVVILGLTSAVASFVRALSERLRPRAAALPGLDGVVAVAHTEGSGRDPLNNADLLLRTLAGFAVHPNVAAVLLVGDDAEPVTPAGLIQFMEAGGYPLHAVLHETLRLTGNFQADLERGTAIIEHWLAAIRPMSRTDVSLAHLRVALQCGGSDAFSGISANPLLASLAKEILRYGGAANLAETLELVGAEAYVLQNVRDLETARRFLRLTERYKALVSWHGASPEGNTSGGNRYRGLYNITLKSLGAAQKRHPDVRLDYVIEYAERMTEPGFYFMDSPGNDLESIAGQVASGANLIGFTTGNGSITNFPFVPTIKFVSTTARYHLLSREMDINAGAYLDGVPMEALTRDVLERTIAIASGERSVGERAGHSQVSIWRNWRQTDARRVETALAQTRLTGHSIPIRPDEAGPSQVQFQAIRAGGRAVTDQVGLILPTSLCAGQIARLGAEALNHKLLGRAGRLSRFVALVHTEGCGVTGPSAQPLLSQTLLNYARHPLVGCGLLLEHGCEITHNDFFRRQLAERGLNPGHFGWASVQLDGGLDKVLDKMERWFAERLAHLPPPEHVQVGVGALRLGLLSEGTSPEALAQAMARLAQTVVHAGGTVVVPHTSTASLLQTNAFRAILESELVRPSLAYGQTAEDPGFHVMEAPSSHWAETLTGLGATGVEIIVAWPGERPRPGHPLVPVIQITMEALTPFLDEYDLILSGPPEGWSEQLLQRVADVASRRYSPKATAHGAVDFQITRGLFGVSV